MGESSLMRTLLLSTQEPSGSSISRLGLKSALIDAIWNNALLGNDISANSRNLAMHCWELFRSWSSSHYWLGKACRTAGRSSFWSSWSWSTRSPPFLLVFCCYFIKVLTRLLLLSRWRSLNFHSMLVLKMTPSCFSWQNSLIWSRRRRCNSIFSFLLISSPYPDFPLFLAFAQAMLVTAIAL